MNRDFKTKSKYLLLLFLVALCYFVLAKLGLLLATINKTASPVWPASGLAIGAMLLFGYRIWPAVFVAALIANLQTDAPLLTTLVIAIGNSLEAIIAKYLYDKLRKISYQTSFSMNTLALLLAIMIAAAVGSSIGLLSLMTTSTTSLQSAQGIWLTWWIGDFVGALVVSPILLSFRKEFLEFKKWGIKKTIHVLLVLFFSAWITWCIFNIFKFAPMIFLLFPLLLYSNRKFNIVVTNIFVLVVCAVCVWCTATGVGLFISRSMNENLIHLQLFLLSFSITANVLSALKDGVFLRRPVLVLLCGWAICTLVFYSVQKSEQNKDDAHFEDLIDDQTNSIITHFEYYVEALEGGASLLAANSHVTPKQWKLFVSRSQIVTRRPGINGIGIIWPVKQSELQRYVHKVREQGIGDFTYKKVPNVEFQMGPDLDSYIITYIEPFENNMQARGLDIGSESNRRSSAEVARDSGMPAITKKIILVQAAKKGPGFLLYVPMYKTAEIPQTLEERRKLHVGWIYAPFVTANFLNSALTANSKELSFALFEGDSVQKEYKLYQSAEIDTAYEKFEKINKINIGQQVFTIGWNRSDAFISTNDSTSAYVALSGILMVLVLTVLMVNLETTGKRAQNLANEQTRLLRINEESLKTALLKAEAATKVKSEFVANMSHEIRTPLNGIIGMTTLLFNNLMDPVGIERLKIIQNCGNSLLNLINDILDFSKLEAGKVDIESKAFSLPIAVQEVVEMMRPKTIEKGIKLTYTIDASVPQWIEGDSNRIKQILMNLVSNSIKFTEFGGVDIQSRAVKSDSNTLTVYFSIKDTGIGISDEVKDKLFQSFSQVDASTTRRFGGSGLGLAICKGLCEKMGGSIGVESQPGKGSNFYFTFKANEVHAQELAPVPEAENDCDLASKFPLRILLAEDNPVNQIVAVGLLEKLGYSCEVVSNGLEAIERISHKKYDLIFMDCHMPEVDGFEATKSIVKMFPEEDRPRILALTASAMKQDIDRCLECGMNGFLGKPITINTLYKAIQEQVVFIKKTKKAS